MEPTAVLRPLIPIQSESDIPEALRGTPIALFLEYHNLGRPFDRYTRAQMLIGMCMDNRNHLRIPENFAYIIRAGGANLRHSEFKVSYAIGVGGARAIALLGHTDCGMVHLADRRDAFIQGLIDRAGWSRQQATEHFHQFAPIFEIGNAQDFVVSEAERLNKRYPNIPVVPMMYKTEENRVYLIEP